MDFTINDDASDAVRQQFLGFESSTSNFCTDLEQITLTSNNL
jgi:hypothetical protein